MAVMGRLLREGHAVRVMAPTAEYPRRMLKTVGGSRCPTHLHGGDRVWSAPDGSETLSPHHSGPKLQNSQRCRRHRSGTHDGVRSEQSGQPTAECRSARCARRGCEQRGRAFRFPRGRFRARPTQGAPADIWALLVHRNRHRRRRTGDSGLPRGWPTIERRSCAALDEGVSGTGDPHRGIGLAEIERLVQEPRRQLVIHSGRGLVTVTAEWGRVATDTDSIYPGTLLAVFDSRGSLLTRSIGPRVRMYGAASPSGGR